MQFLKGVIRFLIMVAAVVFLAWLIITFALKKVSVIGSSMETTLYNGEDVIVNKTSYVLFSPKRNQIIAFYPEAQDEEETTNSDSMIHIRRVAGLPGEKVQIKNGKLYINGEEQKEKYDFEAMHSGGRAVNEIHSAVLLHAQRAECPYGKLLNFARFVVGKRGGTKLGRHAALIFVFVVVKAGFRNYLNGRQRFAVDHTDCQLASLYEALHNEAGFILARGVQRGIKLVGAVYRRYAHA